MVQVNIHWKGGYCSEAHVRGFKLLIDKSKEGGGSNEGPSPAEVLLASLGGCSMMGIVRFAEKMRLDLKDAFLTITGEVGSIEKGVEDAPRLLGKIKVSAILGIGKKDRQRVVRLMGLAEKYCTVSNTLKLGTEVSFKLVE